MCASSAGAGVAGIACADMVCAFGVARDQIVRASRIDWDMKLAAARALAGSRASHQSSVPRTSFRARWILPFFRGSHQPWPKPPGTTAPHAARWTTWRLTPRPSPTGFDPRERMERPARDVERPNAGARSPAADGSTVHSLKDDVARMSVAEPGNLIEELRLALRRILKWAEAYEPPRDRRRAYDADLDAAEALLARTEARSARARGSVR